MGDRMVAQSSVAWTSLTVAWARRASASAGAQGGRHLLVFLPADGCRLEHWGIAFLVDGRLGADRFNGREGRLGLLQLGLQIGVIQPQQHIPAMDFLARLEIDLDDTCQQFRANRGLMHGADGAHRGFVNRQADQTHRFHLAPNVRCLRHRRRGLGWDLRRELAGQPQQEYDDSRGKGEEGHDLATPSRPLRKDQRTRHGNSPPST